MDAKVKEFLEKKQAEGNDSLVEAKHSLLERLGLVERVEVKKEENPISSYYDNESGKFVYYKYAYPEITDEEYKQLLKYDPDRKAQSENNGEEGLSIVATIYLFLCATACLICIFAALVDGGFVWAIYGVSALVSGLVQYWIVKVFTNISRKSTAIYKLLEDKEK